jgi:hypothetical protein
VTEVAGGAGGDRVTVTRSGTGGTVTAANGSARALWFKKFMCGREALTRGLKYLVHEHQIE